MVSASAVVKAKAHTSLFHENILCPSIMLNGIRLKRARKALM